MLGTLAAVLLFLIGSGLIILRSRCSAENCRRYLATIQRWHPHGLSDGTLPVMPGTNGILTAMTRGTEIILTHHYPAHIFKRPLGDGAVTVKDRSGFYRGQLEVEDVDTLSSLAFESSAITETKHGGRTPSRRTAEQHRQTLHR